jgi:hypothetical protein
MDSDFRLAPRKPLKSEQDFAPMARGEVRVRRLRSTNKPGSPTARKAGTGQCQGDGKRHQPAYEKAAFT